MICFGISWLCFCFVYDDALDVHNWALDVNGFASGVYNFAFELIVAAFIGGEDNADDDDDTSPNNALQTKILVSRV